MTDEWASILAKTRLAVVQVRSLTVRAFDMNEPSPTMGTAFVVDKSLGLLLSNRHVVSTAPCRAEALFCGDEEVPIKPFYVDPIHDFGFFRYDPKALRNIKVNELVLDPSGARPGIEIRVLGSDAGERSMVLRGTIARVDRNAPEYEAGSGFLDHNTFYIAAACDTSGGSSGSPVIDKRGKVVALNAGAAMDAASSFFLPLDWAVRALTQIRRYLRGELGPKMMTLREAIPRGSIQCVLTSTPMPECKRFGVTNEEEALIRMNTKSHGYDMLAVARVVLNSPADQAGIRVGDILLSMDGKPVNDFKDLEAQLDANVSLKKPVKLRFRRYNKLLDVEIVPSDAYRFILDEFLELSEGVLHEIGFSHAVDFNFPLNRVIVQSPCFCLEDAEMIPGSVLLSIDNKKVESCGDLASILAQKKHKELMRIQSCHLANRFSEDVSIAHMDRKWSNVLWYKRDSKDFSKWNVETVGVDDNNNPSASITKEEAEEEAKTKDEETKEEEIVVKVNKSNVPQHLLLPINRALVMVYFRLPVPFDGNSHTSFLGTGYVVDKKEGLILTDRNTVASTLGDCLVDFNTFSHVRVPAQVVFLHPLQNVAILKFDPNLLGKDKDLLEQVEFVDGLAEGQAGGRPLPDVRPGDVLMFIGYSERKELMHLPNLKVTGISRGTVLTTTLPRFAGKNFEQVAFDYSVDGSLGGIYVDGSFRARVWGTTYSFDEDEKQTWVPTTSGSVARAIKLVLQNGSDSSTLRSLACDFGIVPLHRAKFGFKLGNEWARKAAKGVEHNEGARELLKVLAVMAGTPPSKQLQAGDICLAIDGVVSSDYAVFENVMISKKDTVALTILRNGQVLENIPVELARLSTKGTRRTIRWAGLYLQPTPDFARWHSYVPTSVTSGEEGVYACTLLPGSPSNKAGMVQGCWLVEINGTPVNSLNEFMDIVKSLPKDTKIVRVRTNEWQGAEYLWGLDIDEEFWPTVEFIYDENIHDWTRIEH